MMNNLGKMREQVSKFEKFIQENDAKRSRWWLLLLNDDYDAVDDNDIGDDDTF